MLRAYNAKKITDHAVLDNFNIEVGNNIEYVQSVEQLIYDTADTGIYQVPLPIVGRTSDEISFMIIYLQKMGYSLSNIDTSPIIYWNLNS